MEVTAQTVIENAKGLAALPEVYSRINEKIDDEHSSNTQIGALIAVDTALTSKLLRMVNSAYFGLASPVSDISSAVNLIGRWEIKSLLLGSAANRLFDRPEDVTYLRQFWKHSIRTGLFARLICLKLPVGESPEVMFTAGILHDLGRLLIRYQLSTQHQRIEHLIQTESIPETTAEIQVLVFDHAELGSLFIRTWELPESLCTLVRSHHSPRESGSLNFASKLLALANLLAEFENNEEGYASNSQILSLCRELGISTEMLPDINVLVDEYLTIVMRLLQ